MRYFLLQTAARQRACSCQQFSISNIMPSYFAVFTFPQLVSSCTEWILCLISYIDVEMEDFSVMIILSNTNIFVVIRFTFTESSLFYMQFLCSNHSDHMFSNWQLYRMKTMYTQVSDLKSTQTVYKCCPKNTPHYWNYYSKTVEQSQCAALKAHACAHRMRLHHVMGDIGVESDGSTM